MFTYFILTVYIILLIIQFILNYIIYLFTNMDLFHIKSTQLVHIITTNQNRTLAEDINLLDQYKPDPTAWILNELLTHPKNGINKNQIEIEQRIKIFGSNQKKKIQPPGFFQLMWESLEDFTLRILLVASIISIVIQVGTATSEERSIAWIQGFAIFVAVILSSLVTTTNNYQKQRQFVQIIQKEQSNKKVITKRNNLLQQIHRDKILVGDIIMLKQGMIIPSDGYLLQASELTVDQSALTGESIPIQKDIFENCLKKEKQITKTQDKEIDKFFLPSPILLSGTLILTGSGVMVALVVGEKSCQGKIQALASQKDKTQTPLQQKLEAVSLKISKFGLWAAISIVVILLIRFGIVKIITRQWNNSIDIMTILNYFILGITVIVVAIPEGLPLAVSLSLAFSIKKMLLDQNLVRRMEACQTMGGANIICTDKTGTLTLNKMTLVEYYNTKRISFDYQKDSLKLENYFDPAFANLFVISACVNSSALLRPTESGSSTQIGILKLTQKFGINYQVQRQANKIIKCFPFNSLRKRMSVIIEFKQQLTLFTKGGAEIILSSCTKQYNLNSHKIQFMTEDRRNEIYAAIESMAQDSLRAICLAYKSLRVGQESSTQKDEKGVYQIQKQSLIFLCVLGVRDVPRPQVSHAIQQCKKAGVRVRMVTGDNKKTAQAIAKQIGIIENKYSLKSRVMEGKQFIEKIGGIICKKCNIAICDCQYDADKAKQKNIDVRIDTIRNISVFQEIIADIDVLARSRPEDKYALVTGLKELGNVVAVTGDGTNDAPALKKADVGFAMGITGTEVARQAASIILLDDNFTSIVKAIIWGRNIFDSIKKFVQFQLTVNIVAVGITLIGALVLQWDVIKPIQMLWVNLIMDTVASLALATQPPTHKLLERKPHSRSQSIVTDAMMKHIIIQAIYQLTVLIILIFAGEYIIPQYPDQFDLVPNFKPQWKYRNGVVGGFIRSGRMFYPDGSSDYLPIFQETHIYSRHFTFIYNTFVMMQIFNFINARKLQQQLNIFGGILNNCLFIGIVILVFIVQILLVTFGSLAFGVYSYYGLTLHQWLISIAIGMFSLVISLLAKINTVCNKDKSIFQTQSSVNLEQRVAPVQYPI